MLEGGLVASAGQLATAAVREAGRDKKLRGDETRRRMEGPGAAADELRVGEEGGQYICALFIIVFQLKSRVAPSAPATAVTASSSARLAADAVAVHDWCRRLQEVMITMITVLISLSWTERHGRRAHLCEPREREVYTPAVRCFSHNHP